MYEVMRDDLIFSFAFQSALEMNRLKSDSFEAMTGKCLVRGIGEVGYDVEDNGNIGFGVKTSSKI